MPGLLDFSFRSARAIISELGSASKLGELLASELRASSVLVVTDAGVRDAGLLIGGLASMRRAGLHVSVYDGVIADPPERVVMDAVAAASANNVDAVVGFGGGSSMDVAKLVAFLQGEPEAEAGCNKKGSSAARKQRLAEVYGVNQCRGRRLPLVQVPTTAGTGSEMTPTSIVTNANNEKQRIVSPLLMPDWAVLDGELTVSMPRELTATCGLSAMSHAVEAYTSRNKQNPISDTLAREALRVLGRNIKLAWADGSDLEARRHMLLGAAYAGMAVSNAPLAAVHALAYPIETHFQVRDGQANAMMLPHVIRFNAEEPAVAARYAELASDCFPEEAAAKGASAEVLEGSFTALAHDLGVDTTLAQLGVDADDVEMLATEALKQDLLLRHNPREVTLEDARHL